LSIVSGLEALLFKFFKLLFKSRPEDSIKLFLVKNPITDPEFESWMKLIDEISIKTPRDYITSTKLILKCKDNKKAVFWSIIYHKSIPIGYFRITPVKEDRIGIAMELNEFNITPEFQGKGYGRIALKKLLAIIKNNESYNMIEGVYLDCNAKKQRLINFYKALGFKIIGKPIAKYNEPHIMMSLAIIR
jgi:RimJ/RimL family protein N-acetyltransferase